MIAILTTKTTHHIFFENQIFKKYKNIINIYETTSIKPKFQIDSKKEIPDQYLDSSKIFEELGINNKYSINEGLEETVNWYKSYFLKSFNL